MGRGGGRAGVASRLPGPRLAPAPGWRRRASGRGPAERATLGSPAASAPPCASASFAAARPLVSIPQLARSPLPRAPSDRFPGAPQSVFQREGGALKPTRPGRLRDRRPIAALASGRKGLPPPASPSESRRRAGGRGGGRRRKSGWQRHRSGTKSGFARKRDGLGCFCFCGRKGEDE